MTANRFSLKNALLIISLVVILIAVGLTVFLIRQRQEIRKKAAVPEGQATVSLLPTTGTYPIGQTFPVSVLFKTANLPISAIAVRLIYPYSGATPEVTASQLQISSSLLSTGDWTCPVKTITPEGKKVKIDMACVNTSPTGFSASTETFLASFNLVANQMPALNPTVLSFDPSQSMITRKSDGQDILLTPTSTGSYLATSGAIPTPTPTTTRAPTATPTPASKITPTPSPVVTPTSGPTATPTPKSTPGVGGLATTPTVTPTPFLPVTGGFTPTSFLLFGGLFLFLLGTTILLVL